MLILALIMINKSTVLIKSFKKILYVFFIFSLLFSQYGKNIVQYDDFDWQFIQTKHFDIYYYPNSENTSEVVAYQAENAYKKIANLIGWDLSERTAIILYSSHNDFQQTNVVNMYMSEGIGGVTESMKNRMVIPYDGSAIEFKEVIYSEAGTVVCGCSHEYAVRPPSPGTDTAVSNSGGVSGTAVEGSAFPAPPRILLKECSSPLSPSGRHLSL